MQDTGQGPLYDIAALRAEFGVTARTLRHYEDEGLLWPVRNGLQRLYRPADRVRLRLVLRGRRMGLSLAECREIIDIYHAPSDEKAQIAQLLATIDSRIRALVERRADINATLRELRRVREAIRTGHDPDRPHQPGRKRNPA